MDQPGPSTAKLQISDEREKLLQTEDFKGELTNALKYCNNLLQTEDLLTDTPPDNISSVSVVMGEVIFEEIINILGNRKIVTEDDLILHDESDSEEVYEELKAEEDKDYEPEEFPNLSYEYISLEYKARTVALAEAHPKWSLATLHKKGCSRLTRKDHLKKWKEDVKSGGTRSDKWIHIDTETFNRFVEARECYEQVTNRTIQQWAMAAAFPYISEQFIFTASNSWVDNFKRKHRIKQRKITKYVSEKDCASMEETLQAAEKFQIQMRAIIPQFATDFILNTDQTGCQYNATYNRTYEHKGAKTVFIKKKNLNKISHSYTAQYTLLASGKIIPFVFLCMQEPSGIFGPIVIKNVEKLMDEYKNVVVTCSKSGKLTTDLYKTFLTSIILPYVKKNKFLFIIDSWGEQTNPALYDEIFEGEEKEATCTLKVIPPKCTPLCQPCDVYFYRQVKNFIKRLQNSPTLLQEQREIASREDAIKIHSLILHQLSAPIFNPMIQYAWFASKLTNDRTIFLNANEVCFPPSLLKTKCACEKVGFIICSWCKLVLCFTCFFDLYHPKMCKIQVNK